MEIQQSQLELLVNDEELAGLARGADITFSIGTISGSSTALRFSDEKISFGLPEDVEFEVRLNADDWQAVLGDAPDAQKQHPLALIAPRGGGSVTGSQESFAQHLHLFRRVIEVIRGSVFLTPDPGRPQLNSLHQIHGHYITTNISGWGECNIYIERAGTGTPVLLLHTAGADGRQFHGLMQDEALLSQYELISFDLPWHGKSNPANGANVSQYSLDSGLYTKTIAEVIAALDLDIPPVIVGVSMAGAAVIEFAARHPELISGVVSSQAGPRVNRRYTPWLRNPRINQTLHVPEWTYGLMSPHSPKTERDKVWWGYSQGGYGVYESDISYYSLDWDIDNIADLFSIYTPPIALLSGIYDYTVPPSATESLATQIPNARLTKMHELGHFPHAENPPVFAGYLENALAWIATHARQHATSNTEPRNKGVSS